jgi:hypothetical protein
MFILFNVVFISLIPFIGGLWLFILTVMDGQAGAERGLGNVHFVQ